METHDFRIFRSICFSLLLLAAGNPDRAQQPPAPVFEGIALSCEVQSSGGTYLYEYSLANPASNSLYIFGFSLDLQGVSSAYDLAGPAGCLADFGPYLRIGSEPPYADWGVTGVLVQQAMPGRMLTGLRLRSTDPPCIRKGTVQPWLEDYKDALYEYRQSQGEDLSDNEIWQLEANYERHVLTLGPLGVQPGSFEHWDALISDVGKARELGWISDTALLSGIQANLQAARQAEVAQDYTAANLRLQAVIDAIQASTPAQRTSEGYALVLYNAQYLQEWIPWPCEPKVTAAPSMATHVLGETHTVTATLVNVATGLPIANNTLTFQVTQGPNAGLASEQRTDSAGRAVYSYTGLKSGTDTIVVRTPYGTIRQGGKSEAQEAEKGAPRAASKGTPPAAAADCTAWDRTAEPVQVTWEGGPDLTVPLFVPPLLISSPGNTFYVTEQTRNGGNLLSAPSVTRYYLSTSNPFDPATAVVVGQRNVPALAPGETSEVRLVPFVVPSTLPAGTYTLDACADADQQVVETNEANNCASSSVQLLKAVMPSDQPPDCSKAVAAPAVLWPPNHKLAPIVISGVTDPDGDPVTVTVTAITQDEPLNGLGDGDTCPDGTGVGTGQVQVRAERSGTGNGRVYVIRFTAGDGKGGACQGSVTVGVPHDKRETPVDDGQKYDSTTCP